MQPRLPVPLAPLTLLGTLLGAALLAVAVPVAAGDEGAARPGVTATGATVSRVTVSRVSGPTLEADAWSGVADGALTFAVGDETVSVPAGDVIEIVTGTPPDATRAHAPDEVLVDLWSGEQVAGRITAGDDYGVTVRNPLLGEVRIAIDAMAGLRFPYRLEQVAEPPDLRPDDETDVIHLVGGDRIDCTLAAFGTAALTCSTAARDDVRVAYERVTAVRLMPTGETATVAHALTVVLRDGSRVRGTEPRIADGRLELASVSGFAASAALGDIVAVLVDSDAFLYLSDSPEPQVAVTPFWKPVAGDPAAIYAPRMDRAFSGDLLRAGERTWLKGIGVFSGTTLTFDLGGAWREFRTQVAVDDAAGRLGAVVFVIEVDGEERWRSDLVVPAAGSPRGRGTRGPIDAGRISVAGAETLTLRVLAGDDENPYPIQDEADWLGAMLVR